MTTRWTRRIATLALAAGLATIGCGPRDGTAPATSAGATAAGTAATVPAASSAPAAPGAVVIGAPAPDFALPGLGGKVVRLADFRGKTVVLEWMNVDCPVWRARMGELATTHGRYAGNADVAWLAIDSTHYQTAEKDREFATANGVTRTILLDTDGKVGRSYDARTTPHMYVVDPAGVLVYDGALDNERAKAADAAFVNYVTLAVDSVRAGKPVESSRTSPYGCSVKYEKK